MSISKAMQAALEARGLEMETVLAHGLTSYEKNGFDWLKIPYFRGGVPVNHKHRTLGKEKRMHQDEGGQKCFWNYDALLDDSLASEPVIITEGELDALAAIQSGFRRVVSVPDGAPAKRVESEGSVKYSYLDDAFSLLRDVREIIIASDGDEQGSHLLHDLSLRLGRQRCKWVKYPQGCKDLNDVLGQSGSRGVVEVINRAQWVAMDGVYRMADLPPLPEQKSYSTFFPLFDENFKVRMGDLTVVTGIPSHGKSTWVNDLCCRMAYHHGFPVAFASFEQHPSIDHKRNLRRWYLQKWPGHATPEQIDQADGFISKYFSFLVPSEDDDVNLEWVLEKASAAVIRYGAKIVVIDPWNEMDHIRPRDMSLTEYTGFAIKQFRKFARKHNIHLIIVAHPAKPQRNGSEKPPCPSLYDISDSAHWYNKCDVGIVVHRAEEKTVVRIAKSRYQDTIGKPGERVVQFDRESGRFTVLG